MLVSVHYCNSSIIIVLKDFVQRHKLNQDGESGKIDFLSLEFSRREPFIMS